MTVSQIGLLIASLAAAVMFFCFMVVLDLRKRQPEVQVYWIRLARWLGFFVVGYLMLVFLPTLPPEWMFFLIAVVFLLGSLFTLHIIRLLQAVIHESFEHD